jgi:hypothetical protein
MRRLAQKILDFHWATTFLLMGVFSALGALASVNIFVMLSANVRFLSEYGAMAVMEGALAQLGELLLYGYFALAMYVGFQTCQRVLVDKILAK